MFACISTGYAQKANSASIDGLLYRVHQLGIFNGNILVVDHGKVVYKRSWGSANAAHTIPLTDQYRFHIGSIAKEFNATAIMLMERRGLLKLDDPIAHFLPELPAWAQKVTVLTLLQYTSGLPDLPWATIKGDTAAMRAILQIEKLDFEPGSNYAYNNSNTFLQRRIVEKLSGVSFNRFVQDSILARVGMKASLVDPTDKDVLVARSYNSEGKEDVLQAPISGWTAVTIGDFYTWSESLNHFRLLTPAATKAILYPSAANRQAGLGGGTMSGDKILTHIHDGTSLNYQALLTYDAAHDRTVILIANVKKHKLYDINAAIQAILDGKPYKVPKKSVFLELQQKLNTADGAALIAQYKEIKAAHPDDYAFDNESELNITGYELLRKKRFDDAIAVFEFNTQLFPTSGNVFDSLGEAYYKKGDKEKALISYKKAFALDPSNKEAAAKIKELEEKN